MFTCGPAFFAVGTSGPLPPSPTTHTMDYAYLGAPFVVASNGSIDTDTLDVTYLAEPFQAQ